MSWIIYVLGNNRTFIDQGTGLGMCRMAMGVAKHDGPSDFVLNYAGYTNLSRHKHINNVVLG